MVTCSRLGLRARYFGRFGDDSHGHWGKESLLKEGVDVAVSLTAESTPNGFSVILVDRERATRTILWSRDPSLSLLTSEIDASIVCAGRVLLVDCHDTAAATTAARYARARRTRRLRWQTRTSSRRRCRAARQRCRRRCRPRNGRSTSAATCPTGAGASRA